MQEEVEEAERALKELTGFRPFLMRVPFGSLNDRAREYLGAKGVHHFSPSSTSYNIVTILHKQTAYVIVHYLTDLRDRSFTRVEPFLRSAADLLPPINPESTKMDNELGGILLLHDTRLTAKALGAMIEMVLENGYKFVPLSHFMLST